MYTRLQEHEKAGGAELIKLIDLIVSLIRQEDAKLADLGTKVTEAYLSMASSETVWASFEADVIQPVCEDFKGLVEQLRKRYCTLYSSRIGRQTRRYFRALAKVSSEPVDIHPEFVKVCTLFLEANQAQKRF